ncbi:hypothetical protein NYO99_02295 [Pelomonas sp. UHG3]|uniref:Uncharacterized protein n=1 Tax=Roseateles hydrophilus TaxID=2975054 RepID=A0ACC6C5U6_9BURK|nr:hypothetical protein [Pelomonas sp. UHG3]MCY4743796.1 hypothetical protein [Pelomonas sp. UHG3]
MNCTTDHSDPVKPVACTGAVAPAARASIVTVVAAAAKPGLAIAAAIKAPVAAQRRANFKQLATARCSLRPTDDDPSVGEDPWQFNIITPCVLAPVFTGRLCM